MTVSRKGERAVATTDMSVAEPTEPSLVVARLRWRLAAHRRDAIKCVDGAILGIQALQQRWGDDPTLDALLNGFRHVRSDLGAINPAGSVEPVDLQTVLDRLARLQAQLTRFAAALPDGKAPAVDRPSGSALMRS